MTSDLFLDIQFPFFKNVKVYPVILRLSSVTCAIDILKERSGFTNQLMLRLLYLRLKFAGCSPMSLDSGSFTEIWKESLELRSFVLYEVLLNVVFHYKKKNSSYLVLFPSTSGTP